MMFPRRHCKEYVESEAENRRIEQLIDTFLCQIGEEKRNIFLCRYWYLTAEGDGRTLAYTAEFTEGGRE